MRCPHCGENVGSVINRDWDNLHPRCSENNCCRETWKCWSKFGGCGNTWTQWTCER